MTISQTAKKFNLTASTLRFYEKEGLIASHRKESGVRSYDEDDLKRIEFITCMRKAGLSIDVLKKYLSLYEEGDQTIPERISLLKGQLEELKSKRDDISASIERLEYKIDNYAGILACEKKI
jgi:DNA-binding transcriptional MerR regulator